LGLIEEHEVIDHEDPNEVEGWSMILMKSASSWWEWDLSFNEWLAQKN
jgi:hypothetical protein